MKDLQNNSYDAAKPNFDLLDVERQRLINSCERWPTSSGRTQYLRFLHGEKLTYREQVLAKCAECLGGYVDGRCDCEMPHCPNYPSMPYKGKAEDIEYIH
jgi:hypothetical protein